MTREGRRVSSTAKPSISRFVVVVLSTLVCASALVHAASFQLVSVLDGSQPSPGGGAGDSWAPVISPDARFVLFASTANNLVSRTNGDPIPALVLPKLNVYLRDRTNGITTLVSVNLAGTGGGNADSVPASLSTNGRYALFESSASDLVAGDTNGVIDVFVRDLASGTTWLVSTNNDGGMANGASGSAVMTPDGRYVAFVSAATNLVAGDTNRIPDVFVRDLQAGVTLLVSVGAKSTNISPVRGSSDSPDITPDGRYVAFSSTATNLVPGVTNSGDIYVRDLVAATTIRASVDARTRLGTQNAISYNHAISTDGNYVAFETSTNVGFAIGGRGMVLRFNVSLGITESVHTNASVGTGLYEEFRSLAMTPDGRFIAFIANTNGTSGTTTCTLLWDGQSGTTVLVSGDQNGQVPANSTCDWPVIDSSGRYVAFLSSATNLVTNTLAGDSHLFRRDVQAGTTKLIGTGPGGVGPSISPVTLPGLSDDGQAVAFEAPDSSLVANDRNRDYDVFVQDLAADQVEMVSAHHPSFPSLTPNGPSSLALSSVSASGRFLAFTSEANNLAANDTNGCRDVFLRDRTLRTNILISVTTNGLPGDSVSTDSAISGDGRYVAFTSSADNLVAGDANKAQDVFMRDVVTGNTTLISVSQTGGYANGPSFSPSISANGQYVLFRSKAVNLAPGLSLPNENLFLRNRQSGVTYALTTGGVLYSTLSLDGRLAAFVAADNRLYVWDAQVGAVVYTNSTSAGTGFSVLAVSPDDRWLAYATNGGLWALDLNARTNVVIATGFLGQRSGLQFSGDARFLTYAASGSVSGGTNQIYLYDFQSGANLLISRDYVSSGGAISNSDSPVISADGRFVAYRSYATNLVAGDANGVPDIYLYDRAVAATTLLSSGRFGNVTADNRSLIPVFSGDGRTLFFESWACDVSATDFNHNSDIFALRLLYASITPSVTFGLGPVISWPATPGMTYSVQYKNDLSDPGWQPVSGTVTIVGDDGYLTDLAPAAGQRFYRVVAFW